MNIYKEKLKILLSESSKLGENASISDDALVELADIIATQEEAIAELAEIVGGRTNG